MSYTPGPWDDWGAGPPPSTGHSIGPRTGHAVARVFDSGHDDVEANARLIAAAPDLLAALEMFPGWGGTVKPDREYDLLTSGQALLAAEAAIAKAKGEA